MNLLIAFIFNGNPCCPGLIILQQFITPHKFHCDQPSRFIISEFVMIDGFCLFSGNGMCSLDQVIGCFTELQMPEILNAGI